MISKTVIVTDYGPVISDGDKKVTDEEMNSMNSNWLKLYAPVRHESGLMLAVSIILSCNKIDKKEK